MTFRVIAHALSTHTSGGPYARVKTFPEGRVCAAPDCATVLSAYNPEPLCALHRGSEPARPHRRERVLPSFERACEACGSEFETGNVRKRYCSDRCRVHAFQHRKSRANRPQNPATAS